MIRTPLGIAIFGGAVLFSSLMIVIAVAIVQVLDDLFAPAVLGGLVVATAYAMARVHQWTRDFEEDLRVINAFSETFIMDLPIDDYLREEQRAQQGGK